MANDCVSNKRNITEEEVINMFKFEKTIPFIKICVERVRKETNTFYEGYLTKDGFNELLVCPWDDWKFFRYIKEKNFSDVSYNKSGLNLICVMNHYDDYLKNYNNDASDKNYSNRNSTHRDTIEYFENEFINGKNHDGNILILLEAENRNKLYLIDGYHRLIALAHLIVNRKTSYSPLRCVFGEISKSPCITP